MQNYLNNKSKFKMLFIIIIVFLIMLILFVVYFHYLGKQTTTTKETKAVDKLAKSAADKPGRYKSGDFMPSKFADRLDPKQLFKEIW